MFEEFPDPIRSSRSSANGVNADGTVVVGSVDTTNGLQAFYTVRQPSGAEQHFILNTVVGSGETFAESVNADGTIIVGTTTISANGRRAVRWVNGEIEFLGVLPDATIFPTSAATDVNAAGNVVVGAASDGFSRAFRWVEGDGMASLGTLPDHTFSRAEGVNAEGNVVVGYSGNHDEERAFRWVEGEEMQNLGVLVEGGDSRAYDVNADGTVVVGESDVPGGARAFRWIEGGTMESLGTLTGGTSSAAYGVNNDGSIVVGESLDSDGFRRAFIWRATPNSGGGGTGGGGTMEDLVNLNASFPVLGNDSAVAQAEQQFAVERLMAPGAGLGAGQSAISANAAVQNTNRNPTTVGARTTSLAALGFGHGLTETVTLGATLSLSGTSLKNNAFDMDTGLGLAVWGQYSEGGATGTGLQISGALGFARSEGEVARGRLLTDVIAATGQSDVKTRALEATVGYGLTRGNWLVTPALGFARYNTRRAAYTETGAAFNASYDAMETGRTVATLSVTGETAVGERGQLSLTVGVDREVDPERPRLTGRSDLPGLATFDIDSSFNANRTRAFASVGYAHEMNNAATISADLRVGDAVYGTTPSVGFGVTYEMRF